MKDLSVLLAAQKKLRVAGFDDAPFENVQGSEVHVAGMVCQNTRFEGMLWLRVTKDGEEATQAIRDAVASSKFAAQLHLLLFDGIAVGGFNMIDIAYLSEYFQLPCIAVMRRQPDLPAVRQVLQKLTNANERMAILERAGDIHDLGGFVFQVQGCAPDVAARALGQLTDVGLVPEALRLAHLVGAAIKTGESGKRA